MIAFVVAYALMCAFVWALCACGGAADDVMEAWAAREQEAEAVE